MKYKVLKTFSYEPAEASSARRAFTPGEEFIYPDKKKFPTKLPIEWLLEDGTIEPVKGETIEEVT